MFVRYYDEGDPGGKPAPADVDPEKGKKEPEGKEPESSKDKPKDKPEGKPKVDDTDYKALHEKAVADLKEFESGISPKLMKLADYEKVEKERLEKAQATESDDLVKIDEQLTKTEDEIAKCKAEKIDITHLETGKAALLFQRKQVVRDRAVRFEQKKWLDFKDANPEFTDYAALDKIVNEAAKRGDAISPGSAYIIWGKDQEIAKAKESADIDKDSKDLGDKALGEDGKPIPKKEDKPDTTTEFYEKQYGKEKAAKILKMDKT